MTHRIKLVLTLAIGLSLASVTWASTQGQTKPPAEEKWTGTISDAMCGKSHGANGGTQEKDHACANKCAKGTGGSYVFVVGEKIYKIADQKLPALETHAGHRVEITGTVKGDTITVAKVTMLPAK